MANCRRACGQGGARRAGALARALGFAFAAPAALIAALAPAARVRADPGGCGGLEVDADELVTFPGDGAEAVALDAEITVRYPAGTDLSALHAALQADAARDVCGGAPVCLFRDARGEEGGLARKPVRARWLVSDATLVLVPEALLAPMTDYYLSIARPGFDRAARVEVEFATDSEPDSEPPRLADDASELRLTVEPAPPECEAEPGSVRVRLLVPRVRDDSDEGSVELLAFVTRARGSSGPELRARGRNSGGGDVLLGFVLDPEEARAPTCLVLRAVDGTGKWSEAEPELCFDPVQGSHFEPLCALRAPGARADGAAGTLVFSSLFLLLRRLARRRPGPRSVA